MRLNSSKTITYLSEIQKSMLMISKVKNSIFIGQSTKVPGNLIFKSLIRVKDKKKLNYQFLKKHKWELL